MSSLPSSFRATQQRPPPVPASVPLPADTGCYAFHVQPREISVWSRAYIKVAHGEAANAAFFSPICVASKMPVEARRAFIKVLRSFMFVPCGTLAGAVTFETLHHLHAGSTDENVRKTG